MRNSIVFTVSAILLTTGCRSLRPAPAPATAPRAPLVLMTDFGSRDGAVSAMHGVAFGIDPTLVVNDLTHEIPPFDIGQAAFRLQQTYRSWPKGTVFVTVVDPGAGSPRRSLAVRTKSGHYFVGPDNGYLTLVSDEAGLDAVRVIDVPKTAAPELPGRDRFAEVGARLAAGRVTFEAIGSPFTGSIVRLAQPAAVARGGVLYGTLTGLDGNSGNVATNVTKSAIAGAFPNARELRVYVAHRGLKVFEATLPLVNAFAAVARGQPLIYVNAVMNLGLAINQGNFARHHHVETGPEWTIVFSKP